MSVATRLSSVEVEAPRSTQSAPDVAALYCDLKPGILSYLRARAPREADDLSSEVWLDVTQGLARFSGNENDFRRWVFTIARRRLIDARREAHRRPTSPLAEFDGVPADHDTESVVLGAAVVAEAQQVIETLPKEQAEVVRLRVVDGLSVGETAAALGKRPGTVRVLHHRGLRRLARVLPLVLGTAALLIGLIFTIAAVGVFGGVGQERETGAGGGVGVTVPGAEHPERGRSQGPGGASDRGPVPTQEPAGVGSTPVPTDAPTRSGPSAPPAASTSPDVSTPPDVSAPPAASTPPDASTPPVATDNPTSPADGIEVPVQLPPRVSTAALAMSLIPSPPDLPDPPVEVEIPIPSPSDLPDPPVEVDAPPVNDDTVPPPVPPGP